MFIKFFTIFCLLVSLPSFSFAQSPTPIPPVGRTLMWDHNGVSTDRFEILVDNIITITIPLQGPPPPNVEWSITMPAMTPGNHSIIVRACNIAGCAASDPLDVVVVVTPTKPTNVRVGGGN